MVNTWVTRTPGDVGTLRHLIIIDVIIDVITIDVIIDVIIIGLLCELWAPAIACILCFDALASFIETFPRKQDFVLSTPT